MVSDSHLGWFITGLCVVVYRLYVIVAYEGVYAPFDLPHTTGEPDKTWGGWAKHRLKSHPLMCLGGNYQIHEGS